MLYRVIYIGNLHVEASMIMVYGYNVAIMWIKCGYDQYDT